MCVSAMLAAAAGGGCALPGGNCTTGWRYEIFKPASVSAPAAPVVVQGSSGPVSLAPLGNQVAVGKSITTAVLAAEAPCAPAAPHAPVMAATAPDCTMQRVCETLDRIEARLRAQQLQAPREARPLPPGPPQ